VAEHDTDLLPLSLGDLRRLDLKPGETLLVRLTDPMFTLEDVNRLGYMIGDCFREWYPDSHLLMLLGEMEIEIVSGHAIKKSQVDTDD
jgi:hypothetical protein